VFWILGIFVEMQNRLKNELHHVISGEIRVRFGETIQAVAVTLAMARSKTQKLKTQSKSGNKKQKA